MHAMVKMWLFKYFLFFYLAISWTDISMEIDYLVTICKNDLRKTVADGRTQR